MLGAKDWGVRIYLLFQICWLLITPLLIIVRRKLSFFSTKMSDDDFCVQGLIIFMSIHYPPLQLDNYQFPLWSYKLGWGLTALILSGMVFYVFYLVIKLLLIQRKVKDKDLKENSNRILSFISSHGKL